MVASTEKALKIVMKSPVMKGAVKYAINKSCEPMMNAAFSTRNVSEEDKKEVVDLICRSLDAVVDYSLEHKMDPNKAGNYIMQAGVTVKNLSGVQQQLCAKALVDFAVNGTDYILEGIDAGKDIVEFAEVGEAVDLAGGAILGGATALSLHAADLYSKAGKVVNAAYDVHSQCGNLAFDKTTKPRNPSVSPSALACYPEDGAPAYEMQNDNAASLNMP